MDYESYVAIERMIENRTKLEQLLAVRENLRTFQQMKMIEKLKMEAMYQDVLEEKLLKKARGIFAFEKLMHDERHLRGFLFHHKTLMALERKRDKDDIREQKAVFAEKLYRLFEDKLIL